MCQSCWRESGSPKIDNQKVRDAQPLISDVYEFHGAGGSLHIVLDDSNIDDSDINFCLTSIAENKRGYPPEQIEAERKCGEHFLSMTVEERSSALALSSGYWS